MKTIIIPIPQWLMDTILAIKKFLTPTPPPKTQEEFDYEFNFHFNVANKRDIFEFVEKCRETKHVAIAEEKRCKCHRIVSVNNYLTGQTVHNLEMTEVQAQWLKQNIHSIMPMKEGTIDDNR